MSAVRRRVSSARVRRPAWRRGADAGAEEGFVGVDVADAVEQGLVEQRGFDGGLAAAEEGDEVFEGDGEGFAAGAGVGRSHGCTVVRSQVCDGC